MDAEALASRDAQDLASRDALAAIAGVARGLAAGVDEEGVLALVSTNKNYGWIVPGSTQPPPAMVDSWTAGMARKFFVSALKGLNPFLPA